MRFLRVLRTTALVTAAPLTLAVAGLVHPRHLTAGTAGDWAGLHIALLPVFPLVSRGPRDTHLGSDMRDGAAATDTFDQQPPAMNGQPGNTVGHEDLRAVQS